MPRSLSRVALLVVLVGVLLTVEAEAALAAGPPTRPSSGWSPPPDGGPWTDDGVQRADDEGVRGCTGVEREFHAPQRHGELTFVHCTSPASALRVQNAAVDRQRAFPGAFPPVAGAGREIDSSTGPIVQRRWTSGDVAYTVSFDGCGTAATLADCIRISAGWTRSLVAREGAAAPATEPAELLTGRFAAFRPGPDSGTAWRRIVSRRLSYWVCPGAATTRWRSAERDELLVTSGDCGSSADAKRASQDEWRSMRTPMMSRTIASQALRGPVRIALDTSDPKVTVLQETWLHGGRFTRIVLTCTARSAHDCVLQIPLLDDDFAVQTGPADATDEIALPDFTASIAIEALGIPLAVLGLLTIVPDLVDRRRSGGWRSQSRGDYTDVEREVRRGRRSRVLFRVVVVATAIGLWFLLTRVMLAQLHFTSTTNIGIDVGSPVVLGLLTAVVLRRVWPVPAMSRPPSGRRRRHPLALTGTALRAAAMMLAALALSFYFLCCAVTVSNLGWAHTTVDAMLGTGTDPIDVVLHAAQALVETLTHDWGLSSAVAVAALFVLVLFVPVVVALAVDRFGRRLGRLDVQRTLSTDDRPYFLYLRGFDEDRLRMREVAGRSGLLEVLTPFSRPAFEELLVERLGPVGPTIAIAPGRVRVPDLGAAKVSYDDDEWQQHVEDFLRGARAVVMSATPAEVHPGLAWEINTLSEHAAGTPILLVLAPWPRGQLVEHWRSWLRAASRLTPFDSIAERDFPDGLQVLAWRPGQGWHGWGARRRWDWTYAASITAAVASLQVPTGGASAQPVDGETVRA